MIEVAALARAEKNAADLREIGGEAGGGHATEAFARRGFTPAANSSSVAKPALTNAGQCSAGILPRWPHDLTVWTEAPLRSAMNAVSASATISV